MIIYRIARAAALVVVALYAPVTMAADHEAVQPATTGQQAAKSQVIPGRDKAVAFLRAIGLGDSASAYGMLSDAKRRKMPVGNFNEVIAPLMKAGISDFEVKTTKISKDYFGYDSDIGFFKELQTTTLVGTLVTNTTGSTDMSLTVIAFGGVWHVHDFEFKPLNSDAAQSAEEMREFDRRVVDLLRTGKKADASLLAQQALGVAERRFGPAHPAVAHRLDNLALTLRLQRRYSEAEPLLKRSLAMREQIFGKDNPHICQSLSNLVVLYEVQDRLGDAEPLLMRSLTIWAQAFGPQHPAVGQSMHELSQLYQQQGRTREAEALYERAVAILGPTHPAVVITLIKRGEYEKVAPLLSIAPIPGDRDAAAAAVGRTFFGQVDNLRWTGLGVDRGTNPQLIVIRGEATHHNEIWQAFEVEMVPDGNGWKTRTVRALPLAWR